MRRALLIALLPALLVGCSSDSGKVTELGQQVGDLQSQINQLTATNHTLKSTLKEVSSEAKASKRLSLACLNDLTLTLQEVGAAIDHINQSRTASTVAKVAHCGRVLSTHQRDNMFASVQEVNQLVRS